MDFAYNDEQKEIIKVVRDLVEKEIVPYAAELQNIMLRAEQIWEEVPKEIKLKFDNDVDKFIASYGTIEWAKNLGIYQENQVEAKPTEATKAPEAKE